MNSCPCCGNDLLAYDLEWALSWLEDFSNNPDQALSNWARTDEWCGNLDPTWGQAQRLEDAKRNLRTFLEVTHEP